MIAGALFFYQAHSWWNRLQVRIRRLKKPKYLFGAIVGGLYFYWYIFRAFHRTGRAVQIPAQHQEIGETIGALFLLVMVVLAWILPHSRAALAFTESEVAFLFPAPVTRKALLHFKLLKSQGVILVSAIFMTIIGRSWGGGNFIFRIVGWWVAFATMNLHLLGSSFVLTKLMDRGLSTWVRRLLVLGIVMTAAAGIILWQYYAMPPQPALSGSPDDLAQLSRYADAVLHSGPLPWVLLPFKTVVAPYFAVGTKEFLLALGPALLLLALHYWWVIRSDVAFEEASIELSRKVAGVAAVRSGNWQAARKPTKATRTPFQLKGTGNPAIALLWKNLMSAGSLITARMWVFVAWIVIFGGFMLRSQARNPGGTGAIVAFAALILTGISLFWGPQMLRNDFRQDLLAVDFLKMLPLPGWRVVLGEVLAPVVILSAAQWLFLLVALILFPNRFENFESTFGERAGFALAAAVLLPCIDLLALLIPNAAVLIFPAWFQLGKESPRGFENTGQQLILMVGQLLVLAVSILVPAAIFIVVFMLGNHFIATGLSAVLASVGGAALLLAEGAIGIRLLGSVFERFDSSDELTQRE